MDRAETIDKYYSEVSPNDWKKIIGEDLHYHFGFYKDQNTSLESALRQTVRNLYSEIPARSSVLDAGCGWGGPAKMLIDDLNCKVKGITISKKQVEYCQTSGLNVIHADLETCDLTNEYYDIVLMLESLYHVKNKEAVFRKFREISPKIIVRENCIRDLLQTLDPNPNTIRGFLETPEMICKRLARCGWRVQSVTNRRMESKLSVFHWKERLEAIYGNSTMPGCFAILNQFCEFALTDIDAWAESNPLVDIVAI